MSRGNGGRWWGRAAPEAGEAMTDALELLGQTPLAIAPRYLGYMLSVLQQRHTALALRTPILRGRQITGTTLIDGIAVVPLMGPIMQRADLFGLFGAVSVNDIRATVGAAIEDPGVEGILLVVDSPGGEVAGVADLADELFAARDRKPMRAVADEGMFSAAYWLGSAVGPITLPRTASVGSIGALAVHADVSGALEKMGVRMTVVRSGEEKAAFSASQPLRPAARADLQAEVDRVAGHFIDAVARQRGLSAKTVREFEAGTFEGGDAVQAGLADSVRTLDQTFGAFRSELDGGTGRGRIEAMADDMTPTPAPPAAPDPALEHSARETAKAHIYDLQKAHEEAKNRAVAAAVEAANQRAAEIHRWCAFAQKPDLAESYIASGLSLEQVRNELLSQTASAPFEIHGEHG